MKKYQGVSASRGICIGPVFQFKRAALEFSAYNITNLASELQRLQNAVNTAQKQISQVYEKAQQESTSGEAEIFQAQLLMLEDPEFWDQVHKDIEGNKINAETALGRVSESYAEMLRSMDNEYFAARAADVKDVSNRILRILLGVAESPTENLKRPSIIIADDLTPSDTVLLDKSLVLGFCTAQGSATSHSAILARGLGLPAVAGAGIEVLYLEDGKTAILDGKNGAMLFDPDAVTVDIYRQKMEVSRKIHTDAMKYCCEPARTKDGKHVEVVANIGNVEGAKSAVSNGAEGVGLLRTEFLYLERQNLPDEEEQYQAYRLILDVFGKMPVVLRTLDVGGDKELPYLDLPKEMNPFLGQRALRLCLARPSLFKPQLRAALRAGAGRNLKIMFPMVATAGEIKAARAILDECRAELKAESKAFAENIEIGIMVEIPAAAVMADQLAPLVDFFSIGTNDLSQYTMAADRTNALVADLSNAFQPAVLRLIRDVIKASHDHGKWTGMCGELAGEPLAAPILLGLGLDEFSASPPMIPIIKQILRNLDSNEMKIIAEEALNMDSPEEIMNLVRSLVPVANIDD
jgi:phosphotransferase system enzyme I (PtsI)